MATILPEGYTVRKVRGGGLKVVPMRKRVVIAKEKEMHEVEYVPCRHKGMVDDSVKGKEIMDLCPHCLSVKTVDGLFESYPCGYTTKYGKGILAKVKEVREDEVIVCTSAFQPGSMNYQEWTVAKSAFHPKGKMLVADPFGKVS